MSSLCRSGGQRLLLLAAAALVLLVVMLMTQSRMGLEGSPMPAADQWSADPSEVSVKDAGREPVATVLEPVATVVEPVATVLEPAATVLEPAATVLGPAATVLGPAATVLGPAPNETGSSPAETVRQACDQLRAGRGGLAPDVRHVMRWVCEQVGGALPIELDPIGCNKAVRYHPIGRLGNLMGLYAIIYSFGRMYGAQGYVESGMWSTLHKYFPDISLHSIKDAPSNAKWEDITYQQAKAKLECQPGEDPEPRFFRITNYPDRNGIDVFHPFHDDIRKEFTFSDALQKQAQDFLRHARGNRSSATYIGFHVRRTDYQAYIRKTYNGSLPDDVYFHKTMSYYRERFTDALFIVCSDDLKYVAKQLKARQNDDIVIAGNRDTGDPGRDMALLSACNHSVITVGTYGFWGAYLAGGTVLVPEQQTHLSRGDRRAPLLEIQLAGATNWVSMRRR